MCMICDGMSFAEVQRHINHLIEQNGYTVQYVQDPHPRRRFAYTIGLTRIGHPEFLVRGVEDEESCVMLNGLAREVLWENECYDHGHTAHWRDGRLLYFGTMRGAGKFALGVFSRYGPLARVLEIHFMDRDLPWASTN